MFCYGRIYEFICTNILMKGHFLFEIIFYLNVIYVPCGGI